MIRTSSQLLGGLALLLLLPVEGVAAGPIAADSLSLHTRARRAQGDFELLRSAYAPVFNGVTAGSCDEVIGRMCLRYISGLPEDWVPPPEDRRVLEGREALLGLLALVADSLPGDRWVLGQRIAYLGEAGEWEMARGLASGCRAEPWWCSALFATTSHFLGEIEEAESAFAEARRGMPQPTALAWEEVFPLVEVQLGRRLMAASPDSLALLHERLWVLADPLYLLPGNEVRTAHYSRHTLAAIRSEGANAYGFRWGDDLHEIFIRYGAEAAFQQIGPPRPGVFPIPLIGRFDPSARGFLPSASHFFAPEAVLPGEWRTDDRAVRSRYTPVGAPRIGGVEVQQAGFRRGEELLLVVGWRVADGVPRWEDEADSSRMDIGDGAAAAEEAGGDVESREVPPALTAGLFLLSADDPVGQDHRSYPIELRLEGGVPPEGVAVARAPVGRYLLSLELLDAERERGWRTRHGVNAPPMVAGVLALSDLLLLAPSQAPIAGGDTAGTLADSLELHLGRVLPTLHLEGDSIEVAWETYGLLRGGETVRFALSVATESRGTLRRALEFLRLASPDHPIELSWEEEVPQGLDLASGTPFFRRVALDLSNLPGGPARIQLGMQVPGREEVVSVVFIERIASER